MDTLAPPRVAKARPKKQTVSVAGKTLADFPEVAAQLVDDIDPTTIPAGLREKLWWRCPVAPDHVWEAIVRNRTSNGAGCKCCAGLQVSTTNSLAMKFPAIAAQMHPELNGGLTADHVTAGSSRVVQWLCPVAPDHKWSAKVSQRTAKATKWTVTGCGFCTGRLLSISNCLATKRPDIAGQLDPDLNGGLTARDVIAGTDTKVWWRCATNPNHTWPAKVSARTSSNTGCTVCTHKKAGAGNSLVEAFPAVAVEFDVDLNGGMTADEVLPSSGKARWWRCAAVPAHTFERTVHDRTALGLGCRMCSSHWTVAKIRDFVRALLPHIDVLTSAELWALCVQSGLVNSSHRSFAESLVSGVISSADLLAFVRGDLPTLPLPSRAVPTDL